MLPQSIREHMQELRRLRAEVGRLKRELAMAQQAAAERAAAGMMASTSGSRTPALGASPTGNDPRPSPTYTQL